MEFRIDPLSKFKIKHVPGITNSADYISRHATEEVK
jgi:hypothetical protein